jgi:hypothetical protein
MTLGIRGILIGAALAVSPCVSADLPERPRAVLNQQLVPEGDVTVVVRDIATGENLVEVNAGIARPPASTMKLLPTWAALDLLGPAYTWKTRAWSDAPVVKGVLKGNLYLQGGGDPLLTIERWWRFVSDLRQTGLRVIEGDIVIDQTRFVAEDERPEDFDGRFWRTYNVLPDAMLVNWQSSDFTIRPADDGEGIEIGIRRVPAAPTPPVERSLKTLLDREGPEAVVRRVRDEKSVLLTDTTFRDAHQSLLATRVRSYDLVRIAEATGRLIPGLFSMEVWGGATFDTAYRFLKEDPWERLDLVRERVPHVLLQMLLRGQSILGYSAYPDNAVKAFVRASATVARFRNCCGQRSP